MLLMERAGDLYLLSGLLLSGLNAISFNLLAEPCLNLGILASAQRLWCLDLLLVLLVFLVDLFVDALKPQSCLLRGGLLESLQPRD